MLVTSAASILSGIKVSALVNILPAWVNRLPGAEQGLAWLFLALFVLVIAGIIDRFMPLPHGAAKMQ
jgi:LIVCS family branched-chain amino acid:cation transporter